jgi:hypothetical protein
MTTPIKHYASPVYLHAGRSGKVAITIDAQSGELPIIGLRNAIFTGRRPTSVMISKKTPLRIHRLKDDEHGCWMTDMPEELQQVEDFLHRAGPVVGKRVCVGGLGLGIVATRLVQEGATVTVVERSFDIIKLVVPKRDASYTIAHTDIAEYLERCDPFDAYYLDTWQGTGEATWWDEVLPLRRIIGRRFGAVPVHCWAENIMLGQVLNTIYNAFATERRTGLPRYWHMAKLPDDTNVEEFLGPTIGTPAWEAKYGPGLNT